MIVSLAPLALAFPRGSRHLCGEARERHRHPPRHPANQDKHTMGRLCTSTSRAAIGAMLTRATCRTDTEWRYACFSPHFSDSPHLGGAQDYLNGNRYEGDWGHGLRHGIGLLTLKDGTEYQGRFHHNIYVECQAKFPNGQVYFGEFLDGQMHGRGILYWPNGVHYEGDFRKGRAHGYGIMYAPNQESVLGNGQWRDGVFLG
jgi:hypothetical protein